MQCLCNQCRHFFKVTTITSSDSAVILTTDSSFDLDNESPLCFAICNVIPPLSPTLPVQLTIGSKTMNLYDRSGEPVLASELRNRFLYRGFYGVSGPQVVLQNIPKVCNCDRYR